MMQDGRESCQGSDTLNSKQQGSYDDTLTYDDARCMARFPTPRSRYRRRVRKQRKYAETAALSGSQCAAFLS